ncbi:unnamed protein product [Leptosia nina]|uniref:Uncharacterized protein n=1 Tax=Leptosia nina TaxID=320188 RepID=A0AAV1K1B4_9NEOP
MLCPLFSPSKREMRSVSFDSKTRAIEEVTTFVRPQWRGRCVDWSVVPAIWPEEKEICGRRSALSANQL